MSRENPIKIHPFDLYELIERLPSPQHRDEVALYKYLANGRGETIFEIDGECYIQDVGAPRRVTQ